MGTFAASTTVDEGKSLAEIERTLERYGATAFAYGREGRRALVQFDMRERRVRFVLELPDPQDRAFVRTPTGRQRTAAAARAEYEQARRQRWRALALVIKAKLEAIESGLVTFEQELAMFFVLPDGSTFGDHATPALEAAYRTGTLPPMLQIGPGRDA